MQLRSCTRECGRSYKQRHFKRAETLVQQLFSPQRLMLTDELVGEVYILQHLISHKDHRTSVPLDLQGNS